MIRYITWPGLKERGHPYTRRHTERLVKEGKFPAPVHFGPGRVAWIEAEIDAHDRKLIEQRDQRVAA